MMGKRHSLDGKPKKARNRKGINRKGINRNKRKKRSKKRKSSIWSTIGRSLILKNKEIKIERITMKVLRKKKKNY